MKFYSRELSQKLQDMGCKSESGFLFSPKEWGYPDYDSYSIDLADIKRRISLGCVQAFTPYDFCGPSETARKNAEMVFGSGKLIEHQTWEGPVKNYDWGIFDGVPTISGGPKWKMLRHRMIDLPEEEQEAFMLQGLK